MKNYKTFLKSKQRLDYQDGFKPLWLPDWLFDFQLHLSEWNIRKGRMASFCDCGLGKGPMQLVFAENVLRKTNKPFLIVAPLAVSAQFVAEGEKFGIEVHRTQNGKLKRGAINVTNYERLIHFDPRKVSGLSCDEAGIMKGFDRTYRKQITAFMQEVAYRKLASAIPAPNDHMELGSSSEALGVLPRSMMLGEFFTHSGESTQQWEIMPWAKRKFWAWMATWSRAVRKPSDLGFPDGDFVLPPLKTFQHVVKSTGKRVGFGLTQAKTLEEQREERRNTLQSRCEKVAEIVPRDHPAVVWCHLNPEGDLLEKLIPDAVQVAGSDRDEVKEERLTAFTRGEIRVLVTKPKIAGFGLNWQHCNWASFFPSHSFESVYQAIRRIWRFGQEREVESHFVTSERESLVMANMLRKEKLANEMYNGIVAAMSEFQRPEHQNGRMLDEMNLPNWLKG